MPEYDPQRDRHRPGRNGAPNPVDALLDGFDEEPAAAPADDGHERSDDAGNGSAPAGAPGARSAASQTLDADSESPDTAPAVTPLPVDPSEDRALARIGVIGAAVAGAALVVALRQLRRRRRRR